MKVHRFVVWVGMFVLFLLYASGIEAVMARFVHGEHFSDTRFLVTLVAIVYADARSREGKP